MFRRSQWSLFLAVVVLLTGSCAQTPARSAATGSAPSSAAHNDTTTPFNLSSLPALIAHEYDAGPLRVDHLVAERFTDLSWKLGAMRDGEDPPPEVRSRVTGRLIRSRDFH